MMIASPRLSARMRMRTPTQIRRREKPFRPLASFIEQRAEPGDLRRTVERIERAEFVERLAGDLEAAEMGREVDDALPAARARSMCSRPSNPRTIANISARGASRIFGASATILPASPIAARRTLPSRS
jgi:hypothetical protein